MTDKGYIYLERKIREHWVWDDKPFSMGQAWIDLILSANHEDREIYMNGRRVTIKRGQFVTSITKLAERWGWDRKKVRRFLDALKMDNSLSVNGTTHGTTVTLIKYSVFQNKRTTNGPTKGQPMTQQKDNHSPQTRNYKELEGNKGKENSDSDDGDEGMTPDELAKVIEERHGNGIV